MCGFNNFENYLQGLLKKHFYYTIYTKGKYLIFSKNNVSYFYPKDVLGDILLKNFYASNPASQDCYITNKISSLAI